MNMVNKSIVMVAVLASVVVTGLAASATFVIAESAETLSETEEKKKTSSAPRYSETCAHGHNGFACEPPQYKKDIKDLQERVSALEQRASRP